MHRWTLMLGGSTLLLSSCDPTIQSTVENGIITVANSFLASLLQAALLAAQEGNAG